jgi:GcrA cell cycle regulator
MMSKGWDNSTLKKLKALMGKGLSTSEIGKRLGLSKNAVVGKLNRLGWNAKAGAAKAAKPATVKTKKSTTTTKAKPVAKAPAKKAAVKTPAKKTVVAKKTTTKKTVAPASKSKKAAPAPKQPAVKEPKSSSKTSSAKNLAMHQRIIQHSLEMANLKPNQCRWPIGDPDSENFHFCGKTVFTGKPYCYEHCRLAYQFTPPKKKQ